MAATAEHPEKARAPMFCNERSILIARAEEHPSNALAPTCMTVDGSFVIVGVNASSSREAQLLSTKQTILEISESLGFSSQSFFGKYFKRVKGVSPKE